MRGYRQPPASRGSHRNRNGPPDVSPEIQKNLLRPEIMGAPIVFLASREAEGVTGERIIAKDFDEWLATFRRRPTDRES